MKKTMISLLLLSLVLILAACGGNDDTTEIENESGNGENASSNEVDLVATDWDFDQDSYTAEAGEVTINLTNEEGHHGIKIEGTDVEIDGEGTATADLEPGEYRIYCSIPCGEGHDEMETTLVVE
ncbi:cupredoxin domain-containing protein [Salisediminibacterium beveridgei]|uniref:Cytochrome C Oxidase Subunit II n=1 Tax=Salisediminibacterium beveridgei TaxID=632773 RepID=A0A1D7QX60_9BACI|nr:cytochrome C oxidase subunit II [Salisediminibacterium beveridgei]AOM83597.1 Cytochrome C Oxidase Subunit II [Salisediminibacterium beveridgei]